MGSTKLKDGIEKIGNGKWIVTVDRDWSADLDSHPRHRLVDRPRFLEGNRLTKDKHETDSQRQKLYDAQRDAPQGEAFGPMEQVAREIYDILSRAWWQRRYAAGTIRIRPGNGARRANARGSAVDGNLNFPRFSRTQRTILHELIHLTVPAPHAWHGRLYASRYLEIVSWRLSSDAGDAMREGYRRENVRWHPRRKLHADHMSAGAKREILQGEECPGWTTREEVQEAKGIRPSVHPARFFS